MVSFSKTDLPEKTIWDLPEELRDPSQMGGITWYQFNIDSSYNGARSFLFSLTGIVDSAQVNTYRKPGTELYFCGILEIFDENARCVYSNRDKIYGKTHQQLPDVSLGIDLPENQQSLILEIFPSELSLKAGLHRLVFYYQLYAAYYNRENDTSSFRFAGWKRIDSAYRFRVMEMPEVYRMQLSLLTLDLDSSVIGSKWDVAVWNFGNIGRGFPDPKYYIVHGGRDIYESKVFPDCFFVKGHYPADTFLVSKGDEIELKFYDHDQFLVKHSDFITSTTIGFDVLKGCDTLKRRTERIRGLEMWVCGEKIN